MCLHSRVGPPVVRAGVQRKDGSRLWRSPSWAVMHDASFWGVLRGVSVRALVCLMCRPMPAGATGPGPAALKNSGVAAADAHSWYGTEQ